MPDFGLQQPDTSRALAHRPGCKESLRLPSLSALPRSLARRQRGRASGGLAPRPSSGTHVAPPSAAGRVPGLPWQPALWEGPRDTVLNRRRKTQRKKQPGYPRPTRSGSHGWLAAVGRGLANNAKHARPVAAVTRPVARRPGAVVNGRDGALLIRVGGRARKWRWRGPGTPERPHPLRPRPAPRSPRAPGPSRPAGAVTRA